MQKIEFFFDYICPFCYRSFQQLKEIIPDYTNITIAFSPCEIHPRPERHGKHSDLCIQGMFLASDLEVDLWEYSQRIFEGIFVKRTNIEVLEEVAALVSDLIPSDLFIREISSGKYEQKLRDANTYAFQTLGIEVVPHYKAGSEQLPSLEGIGVVPEALVRFLHSNN